jgi:group I intron endonuclease
MIGIYKITNPEGHIYIGQSIDIKKRWSQYRLYLAKSQRKLNYSFITHGYQNHIFEIVEICEKEVLNSLECYYIKKYNACEQLNCDPGNKVYRTKQQIIDDKLKDEKERILKYDKRKILTDIKDKKNSDWIKKIKNSQLKKQGILNRKIEKLNKKRILNGTFYVWKF